MKIESAYIHIPFCDSICSYCDFAKVLNNKKWIDTYLKSLSKEIEINYQGEILETLYIGGGSPSSLDIQDLKKLFSILNNFNLSETIEFTFECNIENITEEKLRLLYEHGVNRLSIGIQTFNEKYLKLLNRKHTKDEIFNKIMLAKSLGFDNINIDLIYAIPGQTLNELEADIDLFLELGINHISTYSLMIEPNTKLYIDKVKNIDEELDLEMYNLICNKLKKNGYVHYEISNFSKIGYESKHNLTYWNNNEYYGFGLGASGYVNGIRYNNTKNLNKYFDMEYVLDKHELDQNEKLENEFILGFRKIAGINKKEFRNKYDIDINSMSAIKKLLKENKLVENNNNIYINPKYIYVSNEILIEFIN